MITIHTIKDYLHLILNKKRRILYRVHKYGKIEKLELQLKAIKDVIKMLRKTYHRDNNAYIGVYANGCYTISLPSENKDVTNVFNSILGGMQ